MSVPFRNEELGRTLRQRDSSMSLDVSGAKASKLRAAKMPREKGIAVGAATLNVLDRPAGPGQAAGARPAGGNNGGLAPGGAAGNSLASGGATGTTTNKVCLKPGRSLMDWIRLGNSSKDLSGIGRGNRLEVTPEELARHNQLEDAWIAIRGKVYNVTAYMEFHPGGAQELLTGVGRDATQLFDEVHRWVNYDSMLAPCLIGKLKLDPILMGPPRNRGFKRVSQSSGASLKGLTSQSTSETSLNISPAEGQPTPSMEWFQTEATITVVVYTKWDAMTQERIVIDRQSPTTLKVTALIHDHTYYVHTELPARLGYEYDVRISRPSGKTEIVMKKVDVGIQWTTLGTPLPDHEEWVKTADTETCFRDCVVLSVSPLNHDTNLYSLSLPEGSRLCVPLGYHVQVRAEVEGMDVVRSYTPVPKSLVVGDSLDGSSQDSSVIYLMIKIYPDGALTPVLANRRVGDIMQVSNFDGTFSEKRLRECSHVVMYAAGTGLTPMAGLIRSWLLLYQKDQSRDLTLVFFNKSEEDILWKDQINILASNIINFQVYHVLSKPGPDWEGLTGRVRADLLQGYIPDLSERQNILFCACGPSDFAKEVIRLGEEFGYTSDMMHAFQG